MANRTANYVRKWNKVRNTTGAPTEIGDVMQFEPAIYDGMSCIQPVTANGLLGKFAGVCTQVIEDDGYRNRGLVIEGDVFCRFLNHASATAGTWVIPVTAKDYFTYNLQPTGILLLTDQSSGTAEHKPADEVSGPKVRIFPNVGELGLVKTMSIPITDVSDASSLDFVTVAPCALQILTVQTVIGKAITTGDAIILVKNGAGGSTVASITIATSGSAAGTVDETAATAANAVFARGDDISVVTDGGSTVASACMVVISYIELAVE